jgi:hypothetical protein
MRYQDTHDDPKPQEQRREQASPHACGPTGYARRWGGRESLALGFCDRTPEAVPLWCPLARGFLHWRLSNAGPATFMREESSVMRPASETRHINGRERTQQFYSISSSGIACRGKNRDQMNRQHKPVPTEEEGSVV